MSHPTQNLLHCPKSCLQTDADIELMGEKLGQDPESLEKLSEFSFCGQLTPLQSAVYRNHTRCAQFLLDRGARINAVTGTGHHTALYIAVYRRYVEMVTLLLERGASTKSHLPTYANPEGGFLCRSWYFHLAVTFGNHEIAKQLVEFGSETEDFDEHTGYQVFYAAEIASANASPELLLLALQYSSNLGARVISKEEVVQVPSLVFTTISHKKYVTSVEKERLSRVWMILSKFGHSFWCRNKKGRNVMEVFKRKQLTNGEVEEDRCYNDLLKNLEEITSKPLSLQDYCRLTVRRSLGMHAQTKLNQIIGIPNSLKRFLKYEIL